MNRSIGPDENSKTANASLQRVIDEVSAAGGGEIRLEPGAYLLEDSIHLRSGVRLIGQDGAKLSRVLSVESPLTAYLGYGLYEFIVQEPELFHVGQGVLLTDDQAFGFYDTVATIIAQDGDRFYLDRALHHDYHPAKNGRVATLFPMISAVDVTDAEVSDLTLDGNPKETRSLNGCRGGGVFLLRSRNVCLERLEVTNYKSDGISFQQCIEIAVRHCDVHDNAGAGLHPGSGSVRYWLEENRLHDNGGCGIYYCLRTTHSHCRGNRIERNGGAGISIGEMDTDHLIVENEIRDNRHGIYFRRPFAIGGDRVRIEDNRFGSNGAEEGFHALHLEERVRDVLVRGNAFEKEPISSAFVGPGCERIHFIENRTGGREMLPEDVSGDPVEWIKPADFPAIGPYALKADGARHLGHAKIED